MRQSHSNPLSVLKNRIHHKPVQKKKIVVQYTIWFYVIFSICFFAENDIRHDKSAEPHFDTDTGPGGCTHGPSHSGSPWDQQFSAALVGRGE